jgi:hypothetical protein
VLARPKRFELLTPRFVVWCSIQLSYGRVFREALGPQRCRMHSENIFFAVAPRCRNPHALKLPSLRCSATQHYTLWIPRYCRVVRLPSIAAILSSLSDRREGPSKADMAASEFSIRTVGVTKDSAKRSSCSTPMLEDVLDHLGLILPQLVRWEES